MAVLTPLHLDPEVESWSGANSGQLASKQLGSLVVCSACAEQHANSRGHPMDQETRLQALEKRVHELHAESQAGNLLTAFLFGKIITSTPNGAEGLVDEAEQLFNSFSLNGPGYGAVKLDDLQAEIQSHGIRLVGLLRNAISVANAQRK
jgi:hypothetical protein